MENSLTKRKILPIEFIPSDKDEFKRLLIQNRIATECTHYSDGTVVMKNWIVRYFTESSNLSGNVRSRSHARKDKWIELGITKIVYSIE